jgi:hypothetical protein
MHFRCRGDKGMAAKVAAEGSDATDYSCHAMTEGGRRGRNCVADGVHSGAEWTKSLLVKLPRETQWKMM